MVYAFPNISNCNIYFCFDCSLKFSLTLYRLTPLRIQGWVYSEIYF